MKADKPSHRHDINAPVARVDDSALRQFTGYHIKRAYNVIRADLSAKLEPLGLRITTYSCLVLITHNPGIRLSALAATLDIERPNMVTILDELEQHKWIKRQPVPTDRRANALIATASGKRICDKAVSLDKQHEAGLLAGVSKAQAETLIAVLSRIESAEQGQSHGSE